MCIHFFGGLWIYIISIFEYISFFYIWIKIADKLSKIGVFIFLFEFFRPFRSLSITMYCQYYRRDLRATSGIFRALPQGVQMFQSTSEIWWNNQMLDQLWDWVGEASASLSGREHYSSRSYQGDTISPKSACLGNYFRKYDRNVSTHKRSQRFESSTNLLTEPLGRDQCVVYVLFISQGRRRLVSGIPTLR